MRNLLIVVVLFVAIAIVGCGGEKVDPISFEDYVFEEMGIERCQDDIIASGEGVIRDAFKRKSVPVKWYAYEDNFWGVVVHISGVVSYTDFCHAVWQLGSEELSPSMYWGCGFTTMHVRAGIPIAEFMSRVGMRDKDC